MSIKTLETVREDSKILESERTRKTRGILSQRLLSDQNLAYAGTGGISRNNRNRGFAPGYLNVRSGVAVVSCFADGRPAPLHLLDGLPEDWVLERDICGRVIKARPGVVAGFIRGSRFYTREQAARAVKH